LTTTKALQKDMHAPLAHAKQGLILSYCTTTEMYWNFGC